MAGLELTYRGRSLQVREDKQNPQLVIDGREIPVQHLEKLGGGYWTHQMGYRHFDSVSELARAVVDRQLGE